MPRWPPQIEEIHHLPVFRSEDFRACCGANEGHGLSFAADLVLDDVYELSASARHAALMIRFKGDACQIASGSEVGAQGATLCFDCTATLMDARSQIAEVLILVEVDQSGLTQGIYLAPLVPLFMKTGYRLLATDPDTALHRFAQLSCVSVVRGTRITLASGRQCPVEDLKPDDPVLTRDHGTQNIRQISQTTQRATGRLAPIRIARGALCNTEDLVVSPSQGLHFYQRLDCLGTGHPAVQIKAHALENGHTVTRHEGGFVDYFQLVFDQPQVIYAEGIATESTGLRRVGTPVPDTDRRIGAEPPWPVTQRINEAHLPGEMITPDALDLIRHATAG